MAKLPRERIAPVVRPATKMGLVLLREMSGKELGEVVDDAVAHYVKTIPGLPEQINERLKKKAAQWKREHGLITEVDLDLPTPLVTPVKAPLRQPSVLEGPNRLVKKLK